MTLKELLDRCDFKDIVPHITANYGEWRLPHFKEAFDTLRHLTPKKPEFTDDWDETIKIVSRDCIIRWRYGEFWWWEEELACEIIVSEELSLSDEEIAAVCLHGLTFFWDIRWREWREEDDIPNPYAEAVHKLSRKAIDNYTSKEVKRWVGKRCRFRGRLSKMRFDEPRKQNRAKRMRDHRQEKRISVLERMAKVENEIRGLMFYSQSFSREDLSYLFDTKKISYNTHRSRSYNINKRIDYLVDLFENYIPKEGFANHTDFVLMFRTSSENPLSEKELDAIHAFFNNYFPATATVRFGYGVDEGLGAEVGLQFVWSY